jgi:hypothetical protein
MLESAMSADNRRGKYNIFFLNGPLEKNYRLHGL